MSRLELRWRPELGNAFRAPRPEQFLDFVVDGESLHDLLKCGERVTVLGGWFPNRLFEAIYFRGLLLEHPSYLETGRYELYVCPLCGDIGCGSVTAEIKATEDRVVWRDFAHEVNWFDDPSEMLMRDDYDTVGPFEFDRVEYRQALLTWPLRPPLPPPTRKKGVLG